MFMVIMAGGSGTRFWPVSRKKKPKQFLNICGEDVMVVATCKRLAPLAHDDEMVIILGREHQKEARDLFKNTKVHLVAEPVGRNTAPCVGLGAIYAQYLGCKGPVAFLPADHFIGDNAAFLESLDAAQKIAESDGIVTLGIVPTRPETGYGYIKKAEDRVNSEKIPAYRVSAFVEKPDLQQARDYLSSRDFFWNAGIFVAKPETILNEIHQYMPALYDGLVRLKKSLGSEAFEKELEDVYGQLEATSFDYGIMEKTKNPVFMVSCACGWSDVGSWTSLYELRKDEYDQKQNLAEGEHLLADCSNVFVSSRGGRLLACLGLKNCVIVDTPDALLVADLKKSQDIRMIVEELKKTKREDFL